MFIILKQPENEVIMIRGHVIVNYVTKVLIIVSAPVRSRVHFFGLLSGMAINTKYKWIPESMTLTARLKALSHWCLHNLCS